MPGIRFEAAFKNLLPSAFKTGRSDERSATKFVRAELFDVAPLKIKRISASSCAPVPAVPVGMTCSHHKLCPGSCTVPVGMTCSHHKLCPGSCTVPVGMMCSHHKTVLPVHGKFTANKAVLMNTANLECGLTPCKGRLPTHDFMFTKNTRKIQCQILQC
jgi:hypothetical protein